MEYLLQLYPAVSGVEPECAHASEESVQMVI